MKLILAGNRVNIGFTSDESSPAFVNQMLEINELSNQRSWVELFALFGPIAHDTVVEVLRPMLCRIFNETTGL